MDDQDENSVYSCDVPRSGWDSGESGESAQKPAADAARALRDRTASWREGHSRAVNSLSAKLHPQRASGIEVALCDTAAHDLILLEEVGQAEVAVAKQAALLAEVGSAQQVRTLVQVLADLGKVRTEGTHRATELLKAVDALAARRRLEEEEHSARPRHLRRVV